MSIESLQYHYGTLRLSLVFLNIMNCLDWTTSIQWFQLAPQWEEHCLKHRSKQCSSNKFRERANRLIIESMYRIHSYQESITPHAHMLAYPPQFTASYTFTSTQVWARVIWQHMRPMGCCLKERSYHPVHTKIIWSHTQKKVSREKTRYLGGGQDQKFFRV